MHSKLVQWDIAPLVFCSLPTGLLDQLNFPQLTPARLSLVGWISSSSSSQPLNLVADSFQILLKTISDMVYISIFDTYLEFFTLHFNSGLKSYLTILLIRDLLKTSIVNHQSQLTSQNYKNRDRTLMSNRNPTWMHYIQSFLCNLVKSAAASKSSSYWPLYSRLKKKKKTYRGQ